MVIEEQSLGPYNVQDCVDESCLRKGFHLRVGFVAGPPWSTNIVKTEKGYLFAGVFYEVLRALQTNLNFTFERVVPPNGLWGVKLPNGTWNGMLGMAKNNEMDLVLGPMGILEERFRDFRFTENFHSTWGIFLASAGRVKPNSFFSFLFTFDSMVWYLLFLAFIALQFSTAICDVAGKRRSLWKEAGRYFWTYLATFLLEGSPRTPKSRRGQCLLGIWLLVVLVLMNGFCGQFKAMLMVQGEEDLIHSARDLANRLDLIPVTLGGTLWEQLLVTSQVKEYKEICERMQTMRSQSFISVKSFMSEKTFQETKDGSLVLLCEDNFIKTALSSMCTRLHGSRRMYVVDETVFPHQYAFPVSSAFPSFLLNKINKRLLWIKEGGLVYKWLSDRMVDYVICMAEQGESQDQGEGTSLGFKHLTSVFALHAALQVISLSSLLYEIKTKPRKSVR